MKIKKNVVDVICAAATEQSCEIGGILGSAEIGMITDFIIDKPDNNRQNKFAYHPNVFFLNRQIKEWANRNIAFAGILHTHFFNSRELSQADVEYIKKIMQCGFGLVEHLYFPVFTLPESVLTVFKASYSENNIEIVKDELQIV